jgi:hypothetical protein
MGREMKLENPESMVLSAPLKRSDWVMNPAGAPADFIQALAFATADKPLT